MFDWLRLIAVVPFLALYFMWHVIAKCLEAVADGAAAWSVLFWYMSAWILGVPHEQIRIIKRS